MGVDVDDAERDFFDAADVEPVAGEERAAQLGDREREVARLPAARAEDGTPSALASVLGGLDRRLEVLGDVASLVRPR